MRRPIGIDLFAGAGGMSLGFERAGFDIVAAIEIDPVHAAVHKFNFPACEMIPKSIVGLSGEEIRQATKIGRRGVDVIFGGAPCQGFSMIGHRALDDPRNNLIKEFVRIVSELDATYFVFENVKGLTIGQHRRFLEEVIEAFENVGYEVLLPWRVLNAAEYGVPQDRQRLFLLGAKKGKQLPNYPRRITQPASSHDPRLPLDRSLHPGPSCWDALHDLPDPEGFSVLLHTDETRTEGWRGRGSYARKMRCIDLEAWAFGYQRIWDPRLLTSSMRSQHSRISKLRFAQTDPGTVEPISRFFRLPVDGVSNTLRAGTDSARGAFTSPRPIHYASPRCITVREMARLHSYPDWFRFHETKWHGARQIGNSVPPLLAEAVAGEVIKALNLKPERPQLRVALGDTELLRLDMSQAARYWGILVPIGKRDRKSGAKKRKQAEIEATRLSEPSYA